jgi:AraC-like DNA-binding protein
MRQRARIGHRGSRQRVHILRERPQTGWQHWPAKIGISPAQLRRGFHEYLKTAPLKLRARQTFERRTPDDRTTELPIHRIAQAQGFSSAALFTRTMKHAFGLSAARFAPRRTTPTMCET